MKQLSLNTYFVWEKNRQISIKNRLQNGTNANNVHFEAKVEWTYKKSVSKTSCDNPYFGNILGYLESGAPFLSYLRKPIFKNRQIPQKLSISDIRYDTIR